VSAYRKNEKPEVDEIPVRAPIRWHRWSVLGVVLLWLAFAVAADFGALEHMHAVRVWALLVLLGSSVGALFWNMHWAIEKGRW